MQIQHVPAKYQATAYNCPFCNAYSHQKWTKATRFQHEASVSALLEVLDFSVCTHCGQWSIWLKGHQLFPDANGVGHAHPDMPAEIRGDYEEAKAVLSKSPRSAAALLRLAVQKLCVQLGEAGKNINEDIGQLVVKGLPVQIQQALDILRVIGNEQVHPGTLDVRDDPSIAIELFGLINLIVEDRVTRPKQIATLYSRLPQPKLDQIAKRDAPKLTP